LSTEDERVRGAVAVHVHVHIRVVAVADRSVAVVAAVVLGRHHCVVTCYL
jgi:hypothetical protein